MSNAHPSALMWEFLLVKFPTSMQRGEYYSSGILACEPLLNADFFKLFPLANILSSRRAFMLWSDWLESCLDPGLDSAAGLTPIAHW